jgi:hypothetical protein
VPAGGLDPFSDRYSVTAVLTTVKFAWQATRSATLCSLATSWGPDVVVVPGEPPTDVFGLEGDEPRVKVSAMMASMPKVATTLKMPRSDDPLSVSSLHTECSRS